MELYEALKSGTSAEELEAAFRKELAAAQERIEEETAEEDRDIFIESCREDLADAIYDYACALVGPDNVGYIDSDEINEKLLKYEKEVLNLFNITKKLEKTLDEIKSGKIPVEIEITSSSSDDDIITKFIKSLG